jgi:hypothetical protein
MPTSKVQFKERSARRAIRAACKEGLVVGGVEIAPDGTIRVLAALPNHEINLDREVDALVESERSKWDHAYGKDAA